VRAGIAFRRTQTWKAYTGPLKDAKLDRIDYLTSRFLDRCSAFDQFGPLRTFVMGDSNHPGYAVLARRLHDYFRWRNANACYPSRRPCRPASGTSPHPQRTPSNAGASQTESRMIKPGERSWSTR
jgi:hypothetical protein